MSANLNPSKPAPLIFSCTAAIVTEQVKVRDAGAGGRAGEFIGVLMPVPV